MWFVLAIWGQSRLALALSTIKQIFAQSLNLHAPFLSLLLPKGYFERGRPQLHMPHARSIIARNSSCIKHGRKRQIETKRRTVSLRCHPRLFIQSADWVSDACFGRCRVFVRRHFCFVFSPLRSTFVRLKVKCHIAIPRREIHVELV